MKNIIFLRTLYILFPLFSLGCLSDNVVPTSKYEIPTMGHDLSYISYDAKYDNPNYIICDSTKISSGRNRLKYIGGANKFKKDIASIYSYSPEYETFSGYIVIRFLVNCKGKSGRYRAQSLNLDFSPSTAPSDLIEYSIKLVKSLDNWTKSSAHDSKAAYHKFINLKINNGQIQHVLL